MGRKTANGDEEQGFWAKAKSGTFELSQSTKEVIYVYIAVSLITLLAATITFLKIFLVDMHSDEYSYLFESNHVSETSEASLELELGSTSPE